MARHLLLVIFFFSLCITPLRVGAQTTMLFMDSQPGDFIGGGLQHTYTSVDGTFNAGTNYDNGVSINFSTPGFSHFWYLDFAAANNAPLTPGVYEGAVRFPFQAAGQPGLSVYGDGRGCNTLTGRFEVFEAQLGPTGNVVSFAASFEQHCEGNTAALFGLGLFNSGVPVPPTVTLTLGGCSHCHPGDRFIVWAHLTNPGSKSISVEFKVGFRLPDGTGVSLFGAQNQHLETTLPAGLDVTLPIVNLPWPASGPNGVWHVEATFLEGTLGKTFGRDVKVFDVAP